MGTCDPSQINMLLCYVIAYVMALVAVVVINMCSSLNNVK